MKFGFVYCWTDSTNGKTYVGSHMGSTDDGYIGSGIKFLNAYKKRPDISGMLGKKHTEETKQILSERVKGRRRNEETKRIMRETRKNQNRGMKLVNNKIINKRINPNELRKYLDMGWKSGMIKELT